MTPTIHDVDAYWQPDNPLCAGCWTELKPDDGESICEECRRESEEQYFRAVMPMEEFQVDEDWRRAA